jgi:hypothetical protein
MICANTRNKIVFNFFCYKLPDCDCEQFETFPKHELQETFAAFAQLQFVSFLPPLDLPLFSVQKINHVFLLSTNLIFDRAEHV